MQVVRRLRARPHRHLPVGKPLRERRVLFHREVRVALEKEQVLTHVIRGRHLGVHVPELERDVLVDVARVTVVVDRPVR
jgi:hypothetical protein